MYSEDLLDKPCVLLVNKMDFDKSEEKLKGLLQDYSNFGGRYCNAVSIIEEYSYGNLMGSIFPIWSHEGRLQNDQW